MVKEFISQLPPDKLSPFAKHPYRVREDAAMDELRAVVRRSEAVHTYEPHHTPEWEAAYQKLRTFL